MRRTVTRDFGAPGARVVEDTRYLVDARNPTGYSQVLAEIDALSGAVVRYHTFGAQLRAQTSVAGGQTARHYPLADGLGSIRALTGTDVSGNPVHEAYDYEAFGAPLAPADGERSLTAYAFTGQRRDPDTALQYHCARWLDATTGRWLFIDPIFDFPGNFGNIYVCVGVDPVNSIDPIGKLTLNETLVTGATRAYLVYDNYSNIKDLITIATAVATGGSVSALQVALLFVGMAPGFPNLSSESHLVKGALKNLPDDEMKLLRETVERYGGEGDRKISAKAY